MLGYTDPGYSAPDGVRQRFTQYERDSETSLDFAGARYYASAQGRFTGPDNFLNDTLVVDPQSWNLYAFARNNPLKFTDPTGERIYAGGITDAGDREEFLRRLNYTYGCESCVGIGADGYVTVDTTGLSEEIVQATQYLTDAINSTDLGMLFNVEITNNNPAVAFGDSGTRKGVNVKTADGSVKLISAINIRLDFGDDKNVIGDDEIKASFLNMVFAHEVSHFYPSFRQDPSTRGVRG
jgi:RHS repeat-associated protein